MDYVTCIGMIRKTVFGSCSHERVGCLVATYDQHAPGCAKAWPPQSRLTNSKTVAALIADFMLP